MVLAGSLAGIISVMVGTTLLVFDLEHPERVYLLFLNRRLNLQSWIVIGTFLLTSFLIFASAFIAPYIKRLVDTLERKQNPYKSLWMVSIPLRNRVSAYTGLLIGRLFNVPFWNAPALPVIFMISALSTGLSLLILILLLKREELTIVRSLAKSDGFVMIAELIVLAIFLIIESYGPVGAIQSVNIILFGHLAPYFVGGVLLMGLAISIMLIFGYEVKAEGKKAEYITMLSATFVLIGGAMLRYVVLEAGILQIPCCP